MASSSLKIQKPLLFLILLLAARLLCAQPIAELSDYNLLWTSQSQHAGESMPCGGGDIGLNVWVQNGELLFYIGRSGTFDENNALLKPGRVRLKLSPNPFEGTTFRQELILREGRVEIAGSYNGINATVNLWVDVFRPIIHMSVSSSKPLTAEAIYENWRTEDRVVKGKANNANSYKWARREVITYKDDVAFVDKGIRFYHRNRNDRSVFDVAVQQQGLAAVREQLYNPLDNLIFGGVMTGTGMQPANTHTGIYQDTPYTGWKLRSVTPARHHDIVVTLHTDQTPDVAQWLSGLQKAAAMGAADKHAWQKTRDWWNQYWNRSYIITGSGAAEASLPAWQAGRNYQLFRYMLGCNAYGAWPTKFNGGLFTVDPYYTDTTFHFTPDHRNWGGGTMTAQNQRLVYFPMLKAGDVDLMKPQFEFYRRMLRNAELRSEVYWGHAGACFTEQIENFGLPNPTEYGWDRPATFDKGVEYNAWLEYQWDTVLEFCFMILEAEHYTGLDITPYIPLIESCLTFFNEHYQYLASQRGRKTFDGAGKLIFFPASACETYKMANNPTPLLAGLQTLLTGVLALPDKYVPAARKQVWATMLGRIPAISFRQSQGYTTLAPAKTWERINNQETPQLYPLFPWGQYGLGKPDLDLALNTWKYDSDAVRFRSHTGWKQDNIFAARLGLADEAARLTLLKLKDSGRRFPAFWGPGFDWTPDHNWGGTGMIGLQEMLLQTNGDTILLFPAWPPDWNVRFKLHAPQNTTVEATLKNGKVTQLNISPASRQKDIMICLPH